MDNKLPEELKRGRLYTIPKMEYHSLIKIAKLVVKIWEEKYDNMNKKLRDALYHDRGFHKKKSRWQSLLHLTHAL